MAKKSRKKKAEEQQQQQEADFNLGETDLQEMIKGNNNKYLMINLVAGRAADLKRGSRALVDIQGPHTPLELALSEGVSGMLKIQKKQNESKIVNLVDAE